MNWFAGEQMPDHVKITIVVIIDAADTNKDTYKSASVWDRQ